MLYAFQNPVGVMLKVQQLFTKNYLLLLDITLFLVYFKSCGYSQSKFKNLKKLSN